MELSNNYTTILKKEEKVKSKFWTGFVNFIKKNKILSISFSVILIAVCFNFVLVYNFIKILETIR